MRKPLLLTLVIFWAIYILSTALAQNVRSNQEQVSRIGIVADSPFHRQLPAFTQTNQLYADDNELLNQIINHNLAFGYVLAPDAVAHYIAGESLTAVAGCSNHSQEDWLLITRPDVIRSSPEQVRAAVIQFQSDAATTSCTPLSLNEKTMADLVQNEEFVKEKRKINLSWFIDPSFLPAASFSQANET